MLSVAQAEATFTFPPMDWAVKFAVSPAIGNVPELVELVAETVLHEVALFQFVVPVPSRL
jgi:hypothetical protein